MITAKQAARLRHKTKAGGKLSPANTAKLAEYEATRKAAPSSPNDQQSPAETPGDGAPGNPLPFDPTEPGAPADSPPPIAPPPSVEPPPPVKDAPIASSGPGASKDWRQKWREQVHFSGDGRQMLCETIGLTLVEGFAALYDETAKVTKPKAPDPRKLAGMYVLAIDDLLPERARMTPKIGMVVTSAAIVGERYFHAEAIKEYLKTDPEHQAWLRKQAERERTERDHADRHAAEAAKSANPSPPPATPTQPQYAEPPAAPAPAPVNGTAILMRPEPKRPALAEDPDAIY